HFDAHAFGQDGLVQLPYLVVDAIQHARGILTAPHPHEALDAFLFKTDAHRAAPRCVRLRDIGNVAHRHRGPVFALEENALDVFGRLKVADAAHGEFLVAVPEEAAA